MQKGQDFTLTIRFWTAAEITEEKVKSFWGLGVI